MGWKGQVCGRFKFKVGFEQVCAGYMVGSKLDEGGFLAWRMGLRWVYDWFRMDLGLATGGFRMGLG